MAWNAETSRKRIKAAIEQWKQVEIKDYRSATDFDNLALNDALRVDGVHVYVEILNAQDLLSPDGSESERAHKRYLRYLHLLQRVGRVVLAGVGAFKVDFQNHRLHFVVCEPLGDEKRRAELAVAMGQLFIDVLAAANALHEELKDAKVAIGIDSGKTLAVRNGTRGDRELLFLGNAANRAAHAVGSTPGIRVAEGARAALGVSNEALTATQIASCQKAAALGATPKVLIDKWKKELGETPLKDFQFSRPTPPLKDLDLEELTPANSRHINCASVYADIDGFTMYVSERVGDAERGADAIRALHVLRKELRDVLNDFGGRKVRYIGDCIHGVLAVGERETDRTATAAQSILVAGAMRDAFKTAQEELGNIGSLGLAIGVELGPTSLTRLGVKGVRDRVGAGLAVSGAEKEQRRCTGQQTALGPAVHSTAPRGLQKLFEPDRQATSLTYNAAAIMLQASDPAMGNIVIGAAPTTKRVEYPRSHG